jgi:1,4-alpha-glucan branching enzyme
MPRGYLALLLHAHLPFVRHPEHPSFLEERWLFEAVTESYLPLLAAFERLTADAVPCRVTVSLSPPLAAMLRDDLLQRRYLDHTARQVALAEAEVGRTRGDRRLNPLARLYRDAWQDGRGRFETDYGRDLTRGFARLAAAGTFERIATAATHGFLPLLRTVPGAVAAQVQVAAASHRTLTGQGPAGFWLPECGYYPGLEAELARAGVRWTVLDTHGLLHASPGPRRGVYAPVDCGGGVAAFGRDPETSRRVWSAETGYPGDEWYRDFYRDAGRDLPPEVVRPFLPDPESGAFTGLKYYRVTHRTEPKEPYDPARAAERARIHAEDFVRHCEAIASAHARAGAPPPIIVAPYDAELFGHWWFEGPAWLEQVVRSAAARPDGIELVTPGDYLDRHPELQRSSPSASTWGEGGYNEYWLNDGNDWVYPHLRRAGQRMVALVKRFAEAPADGAAGRALRQAGRCLLLAQASDWAFVMRTGTAVEYAQRRTRDHLARFHYLAEALEKDHLDPTRLAALEEMDRIFPAIDPTCFLPSE